jgi:hypothetical protein
MVLSYGILESYIYAIIVVRLTTLYFFINLLQICRDFVRNGRFLWSRLSIRDFFSTDGSWKIVVLKICKLHKDLTFNKTVINNERQSAIRLSAKILAMVSSGIIAFIVN